MKNLIASKLSLVVVALFLTLSANVLAAPALWSEPNWGISKEQLKSVYPNATMLFLANGGTDQDRLEVKGLDIQDRPFTAWFTFGRETQKLEQIQLLYDISALPVDPGWADALIARLYAKYGAVVREQNTDKHYAMLWRSGNTDVEFNYSPMSKNIFALVITYTDVSSINDL
jgi:hypothetical protein